MDSYEKELLVLDIGDSGYAVLLEYRSQSGAGVLGH